MSLLIRGISHCANAVKSKLQQERRQVMCRLKLFSTLLLIPHLVAQPMIGGSNVSFDAHRIRTGTFRYSDSINGRAVGESRIRVERLGETGKVVFSNVVDGVSDQQWKAVITPDFRPVSAELTFAGKEPRKAFELSYFQDHVSGIAAVRGDEGFVDRHIDQKIAMDTVDQRIDWAAVMALRSYRKGEVFKFHVFDPGDGNSEIVARVRGVEMIHTKAGTFRAIRILYTTKKPRGAQTFEVFLNQEMPRFLIREIFPWGMTSELVETSQP